MWAQPRSKTFISFRATSIKRGAVNHNSYEIHFLDFHRWWEKVGNETVDLIVTDPPYGTQQRKFAWDQKPDFAQLAWIFNHLLTQSGGIALIHSPALACEIESDFRKYFRRKFIEVWHKPNNLVKHKDRPKPDIDFVSVFYRNRSRKGDHVYNWEDVGVIKEPYERKNRNLENTTMTTKKRKIDTNELGIRYPSSYLPVVNRPAMDKSEMEGISHPMQKDVHAVERLIRLLSNPADLVLDPYAGSATTLIAAMRSGRKSIGFEYDEANFIEAEARLAREVSLEKQN